VPIKKFEFASIVISEGRDTIPATPTIIAAILIGIKTCRRVGIFFLIIDKIKTKAITMML
jgi:hypothetical protein